MDEDSARRLLNFGDDYRNYIDSLSDGLSSIPDRKEAHKIRRRSKRVKVSTLFRRTNYKV